MYLYLVQYTKCKTRKARAVRNVGLEENCPVQERYKGFNKIMWGNYTIFVFRINCLNNEL